MKEDIVTYPIILTEYNDEIGHYYVVTSPNIQGMVTDGSNVAEALDNAQDALATMVANSDDRPKIQDPEQWKLAENQQYSWVSANITQWQKKQNK